MSVRVFRPQGWRIRATRRGYQRALGACQSTGGGLGRASRAVSRVPSGVMRERYVLTDQIGAGGMGSVWRAWDRDERRWVAAKLVDRVRRPGPGPLRARAGRAGASSPRRPSARHDAGWSGDGPRARWQRRAAARRPRSASRLLCAGAPRADARRPGRRARGRSRAPRRQARQPAARADRHGPSLGTAGRLRRRRPHQRTANDERRWRRYLRLPGTRASRRRTTRPATGPVRRRGGRHRAAHRRATGPASTRRAAGRAPGRVDRDRSRAPAGHSCPRAGPPAPPRRPGGRPLAGRALPSRGGGPVRRPETARPRPAVARAGVRVGGAGRLRGARAWPEGSPRGWC